MKRPLSTGTKELTRIATFKLQFHLLRSSLLLVGLLVLLNGCNNLMADDEVETGLPAFRHYIPNVSQEVPLGESLQITNLEITVTGVRSSDGRNDEEVRKIPPVGQRFFLVNVTSCTFMKIQGACLENTARLGPPWKHLENASGGPAPKLSTFSTFTLQHVLEKKFFNAIFLT